MEPSAQQPATVWTECVAWTCSPVRLSVKLDELQRGYRNEQPARDPPCRSPDERGERPRIPQTGLLRPVGDRQQRRQPFLYYVWLNERLFFHNTVARGHLRANVD